MSIMIIIDLASKGRNSKGRKNHKAEIQKAEKIKRPNAQKAEFSKGRMLKRPNSQKAEYSKGRILATLATVHLPCACPFRPFGVRPFVNKFILFQYNFCETFARVKISTKL